MVEERDENDVVEQAEEENAETSQPVEAASLEGEQNAAGGEESEEEELDSVDVEEIDVTCPPPPPQDKEIAAASLPLLSGQDEDLPTATVPPPVPMGRNLDNPEVLLSTLTEKQGEVAEEIDLDSVEEITESGLFGVDDGPSAFRTPRMRRRHKRPQEWWAEIFDDDYLSLLPTPTPRDDRREVDFIERSLSLKKGSLVLDLACGNGRHAVGMARRGYRIVGVDLSLPMLARAGELAQEADQKINFIHGDMRELGFDKTFDGIYCIGTSLGYFDDSTNIQVLEGIARALKPGAPFLLEVSNRDLIIGKQPNLIWFEGSGAVCMEETDFNYSTSRLHVKRQLIFGNSGRQVDHALSVRLYSLHELSLILGRAGFVVHQVAGHQSTPGAFFGADSAKIIILAARPK